MQSIQQRPFIPVWAHEQLAGRPALVFMVRAWSADKCITLSSVPAPQQLLFLAGLWRVFGSVYSVCLISALMKSVVGEGSAPSLHYYLLCLANKFKQDVT